MANIRPSRYLEEILFATQSSAADRIFEKASEQLFEESDGGSFVEVCVQQRFEHQNNHGPRYESWPISNEAKLSDIDFSCRGVSPEHLSPPEAVKLILDTGSPKVHSRYMGENGIYLYTACEPVELSSIALKSHDAFRICFVRQRHTNNRLLMSRELFETLMSTFEIFPRLRDFVVHFGFRQLDAGEGPPPLRFRIITIKGRYSEVIKNIGYECVYDLRHIEPSPYYVTNPWRLRQTIVYQQHKFKTGSSSWVIVAASSDTESSIDQYIKSTGDLISQSPFEMHLLIIESALSNWRPYIAHLSKVISKQSNKIMTLCSQESDLRPVQAIEELQHVREIEDELIDVQLVLDSLHSTVELLLDNYAECVMSSGQTYTGDHDTINRAFQTQLREVGFNRNNIESLHTKLQATKGLLSSLQILKTRASLHHSDQGQGKEIAFTSQTPGEDMHGLLTVNVLTVGILLYLPIMVVCLFFSTHFVGMEASANGQNLTIASNAWWLPAISVPLIILSLVAWYAWLSFAKYKERRQRAPQKIPWISRA